LGLKPEIDRIVARILRASILSKVLPLAAHRKIQDEVWRLHLRALLHYIQKLAGKK